MKGYGGVDVWNHVLMILVLAGGDWLASRPGRSTPVEDALVPTGEGACSAPESVWMSWRNKPCRRGGLHFRPLCVLPVACRYTD
jgi:hypothetical protein